VVAVAVWAWIRQQQWGPARVRHSLTTRLQPTDPQKDRHRRGRVRAGRAPQVRRGGGCGLRAPHQGAGHLRLRHTHGGALGCAAL